jgi:hypothetical protein
MRVIDVATARALAGSAAHWMCGRLNEKASLSFACPVIVDDFDGFDEKRRSGFETERE